jgi:hypothetical protein
VLPDAQAEVAAAAAHRDLAGVAATRLDGARGDEGLIDPPAFGYPVSEDESRASGVRVGEPMPRSVHGISSGRARRLAQTWSLAEPVPSAEVLAALIPSVTVSTVSEAYDDAADLGALMSATYLAFRPAPVDGQTCRRPPSHTITPTCSLRGHLVETELVALDVLHHEARLVLVICRQQPHPCCAERDQACAFGLESGQALVTYEPGADPYVEVHPVLDDLAFGNALEEQARAGSCGIDAGERRALLLRRQRVIEVLPAGEPLRWRRHDVPQHLAPEASDALRFCAVEGDLDLLDRRHVSTVEARPSHRRAICGSATGPLPSVVPRCTNP